VRYSDALILGVAVLVAALLAVAGALTLAAGLAPVWVWVW